MTDSIFSVEDFDIRFHVPEGEVHAVKRVSFDVREGECLGIVGESGSGKSQMFMGTVGLLARNGRASGSVRYRGQEILGLSENKLNRIRGAKISMIFQDPLTSLTPHLRIGRADRRSLARAPEDRSERSRTPHA